MDYKTILRHHLATLAYRTGLAINNVSQDYIEFSSGNDAWTPKEILVHMIQLVKGPDDIFNGRKYAPIELNNWNEIVDEFFNQIKILDQTLQNYKEENERCFKGLSTSESFDYVLKYFAVQ